MNRPYPSQHRDAILNSTKAGYQWYSDFECLPYDKDSLRRALLVLSGPSGSGKSVIAVALSKVEPACLILRNYTTRPPRPTDYPGHFAYLSEEDFVKAHTEKQFFLARLEPYPRYGYRVGDLVEALSKGMHPILMFRHAGTKYLEDSIGGIPTVFVEGEPMGIAKRSRNVVSPPTEEDVRNTLVANWHLQEQMAEQHCPLLRVSNHYGGEHELHAIALQVRHFLHTQMDIQAVHQREISLREPRYGISLVAGRPFPQDLVDSFGDVQTQLKHVAKTSLAFPDPKNVHLTVLRGRSSPTCCPILPPPQEVALALEGIAPVTISWSQILLESDGAIRAYAFPRTWQFSSNEHAHLAAQALSRIYSIHVSIQTRLRATLGTVTTADLKEDTLNTVRTLLSRVLLPKTTIAQLKLLHYHDLYMNSADTLDTYDLR